MRDYTDIWNGFQIREPTYIDGRSEPYKFDLVKWVERDKPREVLNLSTGKKELSSRHCFSIGFLEWDPKEQYFNFKSVGLRYLEYRIDGLESWIIKFCENMYLRLKEDC